MPRIYVDYSGLEEVGAGCQSVASKIEDITQGLRHAVKQIDWDVRSQSDIENTSERLVQKFEEYSQVLKDFKVFIDSAHDEYAKIENDEISISSVSVSNTEPLASMEAQVSAETQDSLESKPITETEGAFGIFDEEGPEALDGNETADLGQVGESNDFIDDVQDNVESVPSAQSEVMNDYAAESVENDVGFFDDTAEAPIQDIGGVGESQLSYAADAQAPAAATTQTAQVAPTASQSGGGLGGGSSSRAPSSAPQPEKSFVGGETVLPPEMENIPTMEKSSGSSGRGMAFAAWGGVAAVGAAAVFSHRKKKSDDEDTDAESENLPEDPLLEF